MREKYKIKMLERAIGKNFEQGRIPTGEDVCERQLFSLVDKVCKVEVNESQIGKYLASINKKFEDMDRDELIKRFVSEEFNRFLDHYQNSVDLNSRVGDRDDKFADSGILFARFKVNIGTDTGLNVKDLLTFINEYKGLRGVEIGNVKLRNSHTIFEVDQKAKDVVMECFEGVDMDGTEVKIICEETGVRSSRNSGGRRRSNRGGGRFGGRSGGRRSRRSSGGRKR